MKSQFSIYILVIVSALLFSCEKTIDFKKDELQPKIVVNGLLTAGDSISVRVFTSSSITSERHSFNPLIHAKVDLFVDNTFAETLVIRKLNNGTTVTPISDIYFRSSNTIVEAGKTYRLEVSHKGLKPVKCETTVPLPVEIIKVDTAAKVIVQDQYSRKVLGVDITFKDPAKQKNYYRLQSNILNGRNLKYEYDDAGNIISGSDTITIFRYQGGSNLDLSDPIFKNGKSEAEGAISGTPENKYAIFDDLLISGKEYTIETSILTSYNNIINNKGIAFGEFVSYQLKLSSISEEYFKYLQSSNFHAWFSDNPFSEPVPVYSNVVGGMGILASKSHSQKVNITEGNYPMPGKTYVEQKRTNSGYSHSKYQ